MKLLLILSLLCINNLPQKDAKKKAEVKKTAAKKGTAKKDKATAFLWPSILIVDSY